MRITFARAVSIVGHPLIFLPAAILAATSAHGAPSRQLLFVGIGFAALAGVVLGFSWFQVRSGRWSHVDASGRAERPSLNVFLGAICLVGSLLVRGVGGTRSMSLGFALSGAIVFVALLTARWVKVSLHVAFAAFATSLLWPNKIGVLAGILATLAVAWSRLCLGRHVVKDIAAGIFLAAAAGYGYRIWAG